MVKFDHWSNSKLVKFNHWSNSQVVKSDQFRDLAIFTKWSNLRLVKFDHWSNSKLVKFNHWSNSQVVKSDQFRDLSNSQVVKSNQFRDLAIFTKWSNLRRCFLLWTSAVNCVPSLASRLNRQPAAPAPPRPRIQHAHSLPRDAMPESSLTRRKEAPAA